MTGALHHAVMRIEASLRAQINVDVEQVDAVPAEDGQGGMIYVYSEDDLIAYAGFNATDLAGAPPSRLAELVEDALVGEHAETVH